MLPWMLSSAAKDEYMEVRKPKVIWAFVVYIAVNEQVKEMHNSLELDAKK